MNNENGRKRVLINNNNYIKKKEKRFDSIRFDDF